MNKDNFQTIESIYGDDAEDTSLLREMAEEAKLYIGSYAWCPPIRSQYLAFGVGGVVAIFLFEFSQKISGTDDALWVVVGDLPSAYLVVDDDEGPMRVLEKYCDLMGDWASAVLRGASDLSDVFPVPADPTDSNARILQDRLNFLRSEIINNGARDN